MRLVVYQAGTVFAAVCGPSAFTCFAGFSVFAASQGMISGILWGDFNGCLEGRLKRLAFLAGRSQRPILPWPTTRRRGCLLDWQLFPIRIGSVNCPDCAVTVIDRLGLPRCLPASSGL